MGKVATGGARPTQAQVLALARAYLRKCNELLSDLARQHGVKSLLSSLRSGDISRHGQTGPWQFRFHGLGVRFQHDDGSVVDCEIDTDNAAAGFDAWRLALYADASFGRSVDERKRNIQAAMDELSRSDTILRSTRRQSEHLYMLAG
jgi:hypothetical protein